MKLVVKFGMSIKKEVDWYRDVMDFPKLLRFQGSKWEWAMYNGSGQNYELTFSQIGSYDPSFYMDMPSFEDMFEWAGGDKCVCGALYTSFTFDHMRFCPKWVPWDKLK
jgi:hypothetical protein